MIELSEQIAHDLHRHLVAQVETNARMAGALGLDIAQDRLNQAFASVNDAFADRYGIPVPRAGDGHRNRTASP